ncbi:MAG: neutral/alkaline non-lysosomal ceramidase N-terminal domain-containing protein [Promethearchaeota archaeon]
MKVGFSEVKITPDLSKRKPLQLAGYSPRKLCTGIHDDLYARGVYFEGKSEDINTHILMIVCDILGIDGIFADIVKKHISEKVPIKPESIMISATHTHHGPDYKGLFRPGGKIPLIKGFLFPRPETKELFNLAKKLIKTALIAYNNRKLALIGSAQIEIREEDRIMFNRRDPFNFESANYPISVIKVLHDEPSKKGQLLGLVINYACHGTVLPRENTLITADYVNYINKYLKKQFPNAHFAYFNGPCGDINPMSNELKQKMKKKGPKGVKSTDLYSQNGSWNDAEYIGQTIAKYAVETLDKIEYREYSDLKVFTKEIRIPIKDYAYGPDFLTVLNRIIYKRKLKLFSMLIRMGILKSNIFFKIEQTGAKLKGNVITKVQLISLGDALIGTVPGEYFLQLGKEVIAEAKNIFPHKKIFIIELANDSIGYLYTIDAYRKGGYESSFSIIPLGGRFITMKLKQMVKQLDLKA